MATIPLLIHGPIIQLFKNYAILSQGVYRTAKMGYQEWQIQHSSQCFCSTFLSRFLVKE